MQFRLQFGVQITNDYSQMRAQQIAEYFDADFVALAQHWELGLVVFVVIGIGLKVHLISFQCSLKKIHFAIQTLYIQKNIPAKRLLYHRYLRSLPTSDWACSTSLRCPEPGPAGYASYAACRPLPQTLDIPTKICDQFVCVCVYGWSTKS